MNLEQIVAGDTLDFTVSVPDYPASDGWTLKYSLTARFSTPTQSTITLTASTNDNGADYDIEVAPATTADWAAGYYTWARWVEKSGARQTLTESGTLQILADPELTAQGHDSRTHARKVLDAIEAVIENRATLDQESYTINGRSLNRTPIAELLKLRTIYRNEVEAEYRAKNNVTGGKKLVFRL